MYLGILIALCGFAVAVNSLAALASALLFPIVAGALVIRWEEKTLARQFGDSYRRYMARTRRWLGW